MHEMILPLLHQKAIPALAFAQVFTWPLGQQAVILLGMLMLLTGCWTYFFRSDDLSLFKRAILLLLRCTGAVALLLMLLGPANWLPQSMQATRPRVIILSDVSASMAQKDVTDWPDQSRWQALGKTWLDPEYLEKLSGSAVLYQYQFDRGLRPSSQEITDAGQGEEAKGTDLFGALDKAIGGFEADRRAFASSGDGQLVNAAGGMVLLLSDGHDTRRMTDPAVITKLGLKNWPVHTVAVGSEQRVKDISLLAWAQSDFVLHGQKTMLHAAISQHGYEGRSTQVDLFHEGELIDTRTITFKNGPQVDSKLGGEQYLVDFEVEPQSTGRRPLSIQGYQLAVRPLTGEQYLDNNRRWVFLQVSREQIRIAMFEGEPYWDTRFLAQVLGDDAGVEFNALYGMGTGRQLTTQHAPGKQMEPLMLPLTAQQLERYDLIILGRGCEQFFPGAQAQLLVDFVRERGGALVLARGRAFETSNEAGAIAQQIMDVIEPVQWGNGVVSSLSLEMAAAGRRSPLLEFDLPENTDTILTQMPDMIAATRIVREKAASVVLLTQNPKLSDGTRFPMGQGASGMAALVHQNSGAGQVLAILSDGMWQWAFLPGSLRKYDSVYQQFWSRTIRWLATGGEFLPGQSVSLTLSRLSVEPGQEVSLTAAARNVADPLFQPMVNVIAPDGSKVPLAMGLIAEQGQRWTGLFKPSQSGVYVVELLTPGMEPERLTTMLAVYDQSQELTDPSARPLTLKTLSAATHGQSYGLDERDAFIKDLDKLNLALKADRKLEAVFDQKWLLAMLCTALLLEWLIRRRSGLV